MTAPVPTVPVAVPETNGHMANHADHRQPRTRDDHVLQEHPATDLGNARRLVAEHGRDLLWAPQLGAWLAWDGRRWAEDITGEADRRAKAVVDGLLEAANGLSDQERDQKVRHYLKSSGASRLRAMVDVAKTEPSMPITVDQLDRDPYLFNAQNCIIDLRSGERLPHDRKRLLTKIGSTSYDPDAKSPTWLRFIQSVFDDDTTLISFVQRFAGMCLTADVSEQLMVFAHGPGANGKSTLLNSLRSAVGSYGLQLDPRILTVTQHESHPTGLTDLLGARFVTTIETEAGRHLAEALVKQLTGGDPIRARRMRADYFEFMPTHKLWIAGNHLPRINGTDHGIWRRIVIVPFDVTFEGDRQDKSLPAELAAERPGILTWMVEGCLDWLRNGLRIPARVTTATAEYRRTEDHLGRFIATCCVEDAHALVTTRSLREEYERWCEMEGERPWSAQAVGRELSARGFDSAQVGVSRARSWLGIGLVAEAGEQI